MAADPVAAVQRHYPQIYLACHVDHVRAASTSFRLSAKDSAVLAHLDERRGLTAGRLARHLGVAASTLSAAIQRLGRLGYITRTPRPRDRRTVDLRLTALGSEAMAATSVLDRRRVASLLGRLSAPESRRAVAGLALLARAANELQFVQSGRAPASP
jgi:DNA-binding MarR family transcriptional regulator